MLYIVTFVCAFLLGFITMSLFAAKGHQDTLNELTEAYKIIGKLWKRVNDAESKLAAQGRVTLYDETGMAVTPPVEKRTS